MFKKINKIKICVHINMYERVMYDYAQCTWTS